MNLKIFSIIVGILIAVIVILGGTYYYLFEYSKPKNYTLNTNTYTEQKSYTNNYDNSYSPSIQTNNSSSDININNNTIQKQETNLLDENQSLNNNTFNTSISENNQSLNNNTNTSNNINTNENKQILDTDKEKLKQENKQAKIEALKKEISKQQKILERERAVKKELQSNKSNKNKYLNTAREYLSIGKNSRLEPELSTENMKVYILDGKFLSQYRINLLKDMLSVIQDNAKDYYLSIFVKMLPKGEMSLTIYNKDIIFSDMKKSYKYISMDKISPYIKTPEVLNQYVAREEIIERFKLQTKKEGKGSEFSKHINSLKTGLNKAQYFFPFCEIIEITSVK
ncbi:hypothetical protein ACSC5O_001323 [Campylobacter coli]